MTSTGNTPAVATSPGSPPSVEGLEELLAKATPGPWIGKIVPHSYPESDDADLPFEITGKDGRAVLTIWERYRDSNYEDDGNLIVAAVNALPWLLDRAREAERLEGELAELRRTTVPISDDCRFVFIEGRGAVSLDLDDKVSALTAERDRMAGLLEEARGYLGATQGPFAVALAQQIGQALSSTQSDGSGE